MIPSHFINVKIFKCFSFQHKTKSIELSDITFARALSLSSDKISLKVHLDVALRVFMVEVSQTLSPFGSDTYFNLW